MNILKKISAALLGACILLSMTSCSSVERKYREAGAKWAIDAYKALPAEFNEDTCNQFWAGGDVFEFPMQAGEFKDKGWEIIDVYQEDVDWNYHLDPYSAYEFGLNKNGTGFITWIYNYSNTALPVRECTVIYIRLNWNEEILLPGGALLDTRYKTLDEALAAFNKDMEAFDVEDKVYGYSFDDGNWGDKCSVRLDYSDSPTGFKVGTVEYVTATSKQFLET